MEFNHKNIDFLASLNLKEFESQITGLIRDVLMDHVLNGVTLSKCAITMAAKLGIPNPTVNDLKLLAAGVLLGQTVSQLKEKMVDDLLSGKINAPDLLAKETEEKDLPFTSDDVMRSIKDELDAKENKN